MVLKRGKVGSKSINKELTVDTLSTKTPVNAVAATGTLTIAEPVTNNDTMTIGTVTYTFKTGATAAANQIGLGADEPATKVAIVAAINGTDTFNTAHPVVSAGNFSGDNSTLTARTKGTAGNVATTETFTHISNVFAAAAMSGGVDGTLGEAGEMAKDNSYIYVAIAKNTVSGTNWRRVSLGSAY